MLEYFVEQVAKYKVNAREGWEVGRATFISMNTTVVWGGYPKIISRGKNKGKKSWRGVERTEKVIVTKLERDLFAERYERDTGICSNCLGEKRVVMGWNCETGTQYAPCKRCCATGIVP